MNRWKPLAALAVLIAGLAQGEMIYEGTYELGLSGNLDFDTQEDATFSFDGTVGKFFRDYWEVGTGGGLVISDNQKLFSGKVFTEYNFEINRTVLPFVGISAGVVAADVDYPGIAEGNDVAFTLGGEIGFKGFLTENVALAVSGEYIWATENVFLTSDDVEDSDIRIKFGLRFYY